MSASMAVSWMAAKRAFVSSCFLNKSGFLCFQKASKFIGFVEEEEEDRLLPLLSGLSDRSCHLGKQYDGKDGNKKVSPETIDQASEFTDSSLCRNEAISRCIDEFVFKLAVKSFPLCMRHIHQCLRTNHHLRHNARMQYGLFLKGIGLSLEDSLAFWRAEFTKKIDKEKVS